MNLDDNDDMTNDEILVNAVLRQIVKDVTENKDVTALAELLGLIDSDLLMNYLPDYVADDLIQKLEGEDYARCIYSGVIYRIGETGNELGFSEYAMNQPDFPYDIDAYYRDYDAGKVAFKGFDTMSNGLLEAYRK